MIENFPHARRSHCETGLIQNLMAYYGHDISEAMAFGIGSGYYFLHFPWFKVNNKDLLFFRTKPTQVTQKFAKRLGIGYHEMTFKNNADAAMQKLDELLDKNIPVGVVVGLTHLPYLNQVGVKWQFNGHHIIVLGKEDNVYTVSDSDLKLIEAKLVTIEADDLRIARFPYGPFSPKGKMFYMDSVPSQIDLKTPIIEGMKETCKNMLGIPFHFFGTKGIHYLGKRIKFWEQKYDVDYIKDYLNWYWVLIEDAGTGGSGHRYMYGDFLKESARLFQSEELDNLSQTMNQAADKWRDFSVNSLHYIKYQNVTINELTDIIDEAAEYESQTFVGLRKWINKK